MAENKHKRSEKNGMGKTLKPATVLCCGSISVCYKNVRRGGDGYTTFIDKKVSLLKKCGKK